MARRAQLVVPAALCSVAVLLSTNACSGQPAAPRQSGDRGPDTITAEPSGASSSAGSPTPPSSRLRPRVSGTIATGLDVPWGIAFLPDGSALVSERDTGRILRISTAGKVRPAGVVPDVYPTSEGGLLGLAVSPSFGKDRLVYAYLTTETDNRVVRMRYSGTLGPPQSIVTGIPSSEIHDGGRLAFGPDGMLYVATGEAGNPRLAPDPKSLGGKILRITPTGRPAPGNPTPGSPVWSLGHRNVEGIAFDEDGRLWACEFGYNTWDELNLIRPGGNYGWPAAEGDSDIAGLIDPVVQWRPADASPSGLAYAGGSMWLGALQGERLWRVDVQGKGVVGDPRAYFLGDYGRLRTVVAAPDGSLWVTTSNTDGRGDRGPGDDRILRVTLR